MLTKYYLLYQLISIIVGEKLEQKNEVEECLTARGQTERLWKCDFFQSDLMTFQAKWGKLLKPLQMEKHLKERSQWEKKWDSYRVS